MSARRLRFALLEKVLLPLLLPLLRLWVASWRATWPEAEVMRTLAACPRLIGLTYHGMLAPLLAFAGLAQRTGHPIVVMLSPSRDGRLLAALLSAFGLGHVFAASGSRAVSGSRELTRRLAAGSAPLIAVDGPRGPRAVVKAGALRLAESAGADLVFGVVSVDRATVLPSWDRALLPWPFARVKLHLTHIPAGSLSPDAIAAEIEAFARRHSTSGPP